MLFAMRTDPKVRLKREYLDQHTRSQQMGCKVLTGEEWYSQEALRAVNQAVGRVIRHRHDYGAIIFCDERFVHSSRQSQISLWIQPHIKCYSKFGDVVFTLTRFFQDGAIRGPAKMELTRSEDHGNVSRLETAWPFDKLHLENLVAPLTMPMDSNCCNKFSSSISEVEDISSQWGGILPANRSSLTPSAKAQFNQSEKLLIPGRKSIHQINREQDLTSNSSVDEETRGGLIASCSLKKPKLEPVLTQHIENSHEPSSIVREAHLNTTSTINNLMKHEKLQVSDYGSFQNAEVGLAVLLGDEMIAQRKTEMFSQKSKVVLSSPSPCGDEERRGYAFLIQVKFKLDSYGQH
ncbi:hypothetical protein ACSBR2_042846 [Camellia fascicularis]